MTYWWLGNQWLICLTGICKLNMLNMKPFLDTCVEPPVSLCFKHFILSLSNKTAGDFQLRFVTSGNLMSFEVRFCMSRMGGTGGGG